MKIPFALVCVTLALTTEGATPTLPLPTASGFIRNNGQVKTQNGIWNQDVHYLLVQPEFSVTLRNHGFSYEAVLGPVSSTLSRQRDGSTRDIPSTVTYSRVDFSFLNSLSPTIAPLQLRNTSVRYHLQDFTIAEQQVAEKVTYKNLYPNIDLVFHVTNGSFKYDFVLHEGANLNDIIFQIDGATTHLQDSKEQIICTTPIFTFSESIPSSLVRPFENSAKSIPVEVKYEKRGLNTFGFSSEWKSRFATFIIDPNPTVLNASYFGGPGEDLSLIHI